MWDRSEYEKLPAYDLPTVEQPHGVFLCHQDDESMCSGWVGCHDPHESLSLRLAMVTGRISEATMDAVLDYESPVPLFSTATQAAIHGLRDIAHRGPDAVRLGAKITRRRAMRDAPAPGPGHPAPQRVTLALCTPAVPDAGQEPHPGPAGGVDGARVVLRPSGRDGRWMAACTCCPVLVEVEGRRPWRVHASTYREASGAGRHHLGVVHGLR